MDARQNTFDDALLRTMDRLIEVGKKKPAKRFFVKEKRLMYYSGWHRDDKPVTDNQRGGRQEKLAYRLPSARA